MNNFLKSSPIIFLMLIPLFKPQYVAATMPQLNELYNNGFIISFIYIVLLTVTAGLRVSKITLAMIVFELIFLAITLINGQDLYTLIGDVTIIVVISMYFDYFLRESPRKFLNIFLLLLEILIYVNFYTILRYPGGMYVTRFYHNFFLGYDNVHILYILPALCISLIYSYMVKGRITFRTISLFLVSIGTFTLRWTVTNLVMLFVIILFVFFQIGIIKNSKIFNVFNYFLFYIGSFLAIVIFRFQNIFRFLIVDVLHKDLTFTGRTIIWDRNIYYVSQRLFFGYGNMYEEIRLSINDGFSHAHNQILENLFQGGLALNLSIVAIIFLASKKVMKNSNTRYSRIISAFVLAIFLSMLFEVFRIYYFWIIFILGYHIERFIAYSNKDKGVVA